MSRATLASSDFLHRGESSLQEDVRHGTVDVADTIDFRLIDVPVRIVRQEVLKAVYITLRLEDFCPLRADTRYVLQVGQISTITLFLLAILSATQAIHIKD